MHAAILSDAEIDDVAGNLGPAIAAMNESPEPHRAALTFALCAELLWRLDPERRAMVLGSLAKHFRHLSTN
jgi:hypothetical protein